MTRLVCVTWNDAAGTATRIFDAHRDHAPTVMHTVGWLLKQDRAGVSVACERWMEDGQWAYRGHTFIPRQIVVSVSRLPQRRKAS